MQHHKNESLEYLSIVSLLKSILSHLSTFSIFFIFSYKILSQKPMLRMMIRLYKSLTPLLIIRNGYAALQVPITIILSWRRWLVPTISWRPYCDSWLPYCDSWRQQSTTYKAWRTNEEEELYLYLGFHLSRLQPQSFWIESRLSSFCFCTNHLPAQPPNCELITVHILMSIALPLIKMRWVLNNIITIKIGKSTIKAKGKKVGSNFFLLLLFLFCPI